MSNGHEQWISTTPKVPFSSVKSDWWVVQLHCDSLEVGGTAAPEITKPESFWSIHKTFPLFNNNNNKKTHLLQGECHQPCTITSLYCMILHCPQLHLKNLSPSKQRACYVLETSLPLYSPVHTFGTISNNTDKNTIEKALLHLVTPSYCKSLVQLETPSPFSDLLSSFHTAFITVLCFPIPIKSQNHSCNLNKACTVSVSRLTFKQLTQSTQIHFFLAVHLHLEKTPCSNHYTCIWLQKSKVLSKWHNFNQDSSHTTLPH